MQTDNLINQLVAEATRNPAPRTPSWGTVGFIAATSAGLGFFLVLGPRPDFAQAVESSRFLFKFIVLAVLAVSSFVAMRALARPDGDVRFLNALFLPAGLLAVAVLLELAAVPANLWMQRLLGLNGLMCMTAIPALGAFPLALFLAMLHQQAPTRPMLAGAAAGLTAAAFAAFFYAAQCPDDSPLFLAFWYPLGSLFLILSGAGVGRILLRW